MHCVAILGVSATELAIQVSELLHQLRELIATFVSAFDSSQEQRSAEAEFAPVLDALVDPAVQMCNNTAAVLSDKRYTA